MHSATQTISASDGVGLFVYHWGPDAPADAKAIVHIAHGLAEHAARYARVAEALTAAGYMVYADDHRGHGKTAQTEGDLGFFAETDGFGRCIKDMAEMIAQWKAAHPGLPVILLGHSMGSFFAQRYVYEHGETLTGAVFSGSNGGLGEGIDPWRQAALGERERVGARGRSDMLNELGFGQNNAPFEPARTPFDWLSRDEAEVDKYVADPRCGFDVSTQMWLDLIDGLAGGAEPANLARIPKTLPVYIVSGDQDPVGGMGAGVRALAHHYTTAGLADVTCTLYEGGRHEMLNETNRDEVTTDLIAWLDRVVGT